MKMIEAETLIRAAKIGMSKREWKIFVHYLTAVAPGEAVFTQCKDLSPIIGMHAENISALRIAMVRKGLLEVQYRERGVNFYRIPESFFASLTDNGVSERAEELVAA